MASSDTELDTRPDWKHRLTKERSVSRLAYLEEMLRGFSPFERLLLYILTIVLALSSFALLIGVARSFSVVVPTKGGSLVEGEVGPVRFVNPVLALSQADEDLTMLVYSGLMRAKPDGTYVPDLAQRYSVSQDGTTYTFTLRPDATFQDGSPVTSADIAFTVALAQNSAIKSPHQADWLGVQVETPDARTIVFTLPHAYAPFLDNTTIGILPKHLWENISDEEFPFSPLNTHPVGSGPYKISDVATDSTGSATHYVLSPFSRFVGGSALLNTISFSFYPNENALVGAFNAGAIDSIAGVDPSSVPALHRSGSRVLSVPLPRVFGVFFNQGKNTVFADPVVRNALDAAVNKQAILATVLGGYGTVLQGPLPPGIVEETPAMSSTEIPVAIAATSTAITSEYITNAQAILQRGGWKFDSNANVWTKGKQTLTFTLSTADEPELVATANLLAASWRAAGVHVSVQVYPLSDFNNTVLRPRNYDAVLFGQVVGRTADLFAFWNSTQRNDPGLNLAMYTNAHADTLLMQARAQANPQIREQLYAQFAAILEKDEPAIFLYSPDFLYVVPDSLRGIELGALAGPSERFLNVPNWYVETARVWEALAGQTK